MLEKILHTVRKNALIPPESTLVVGVSGGADSLALLHILYRLASSLTIHLHAATFDHRLRGEVSAEETRFVQQTAAEWGIPITKGETDVSALAKQRKMSIETAARAARYTFLAEVARQVGAERIAVAHHADDQAETVLLHLLRGSGIAGLAGMALQAPLPGHPELILVRPILHITRSEIDSYCQDNNLHPREDATNTDLTYLRNRLRHETLPYLQMLNPQIARALTQLANIAAVENDYMEAAVQHIRQNSLILTTDGRVSIEREKFSALHPALQRRLLAWAAEQIAGTKQDIAYVHIVAAAAVAQRGRLGAVSELPGGLRLRVDYEAIVVEYADMLLPETNLPLLNENEEIPVNIPGTTILPGGWQLIAALTPEAETQIRLVIPKGSPAVLRTRHTGDRFAPLGLDGHTQKISRWMVNHKLPHQLRDQLPLLVINGEIAAVYTGETWTISHQYAVRDSDQNNVYFHFRRIL